MELLARRNKVKDYALKEKGGERNGNIFPKNGVRSGKRLREMPRVVKYHNSSHV